MAVTNLLAAGRVVTAVKYGVDYIPRSRTRRALAPEAPALIMLRWDRSAPFTKKTLCGEIF